MLLFEFKNEDYVPNRINNKVTVSYVDTLNLFGQIIVSEGTPIQLIKSEFRNVDWCIEFSRVSIADIRTMLQLGAKKLLFPRHLVKKAAQRISKNIIDAKILLGEDMFSRKGKEDNVTKILQIFRELEPYCSELTLVNDPNIPVSWADRLNTFKELKKNTDLDINVILFNDFSYAVDLERIGINPILQSDEMFNETQLNELIIQILDFKKNKGLIPTIVVNEDNEALMLAYSNQQSVKKALETKQGVYFSRSRNMIWVKGETSGNFQKLLKIRYDCDADTLLYTVRQKGKACHLGRYSCFGKKKFGFSDLFQVIRTRITNAPPDSYTSKIASNEPLLLDKIREESLEVVNYKDQENLIWEIADLSYFILTLMAIKGIDIQDIVNELWKRRNNER